MAYDSDTRVKEKLKDISRKAGLKRLKLRIFDESNEDQKHWTKGGLTFGSIECLYGSNDAGWFIESPYISKGKQVSNVTPVLIVEGSYGTETGNTGSAQYARFSHALGAAKEGFIGVYFIPFRSVYRKGDGSSMMATVRYDMLYAAINVSELEKGEYLFVDAYDEILMLELLQTIDDGDEEEIKKIILRIKSYMKDFADRYGVNRKFLYTNGKTGKLLMFNVVSFSAYNFRTKVKYRAGQYRNGHTIVGDALINYYRYKKPFDLVLARFTHQDCKELDKLKQKEWTLLRTTDNITVVTLDDLEFDDLDLRKDLYEFIDILPLTGNKLKYKNILSKKIHDGFKEGTISVNEEKVIDNKYKG